MKRTFRLFTFFLLLSFSGAIFAQAVEKIHIEVLLDVSGSMEFNDPKGLRNPSTQLFIHLVPNNARVGISTFGDIPKELIPSGVVTPAWRNITTPKIMNITSHDRHTDIESALKYVIQKFPDGNTKKIILFVSDGEIDLGASENKNNASKEAVLNKILPELKNKDIRILSIGLSEKSDTELLSTLANETQGQYIFAKTAQDLPEALLKLLGTTYPQEELPLTGNGFKVDAGIKALKIFSPKSKEPLEIKLPNSATLKVGSIEADGKVKWTQNDAFNFVYITDPAAGEWKISKSDPTSSRVIVDSSLQLHMEPLPTHLFVGERFFWRGAFYSAGRKITDKKFLSGISFSLYINGVARLNSHQLLLNLKKNGDFVVPLYVLPQNEKLTEVELVFKAESFERKIRQSVSIHEKLFYIEESARHSLMLRSRLAGTHFDKLKLINVMLSGNLSRESLAASGFDQIELPLDASAGQPEHSLISATLKLKGVDRLIRTSALFTWAIPLDVVSEDKKMPNSSAMPDINHQGQPKEQMQMQQGAYPDGIRVFLMFVNFLFLFSMILSISLLLYFKRRRNEK